MFAVVDVDANPRLRSIMRSQQSGHDFDVITRAGMGATDNPQESPFALLDIAFIEADLAIELSVRVDDYRESLLALVRSRRLTLMDRERAHAFQTKSSARAVREGTSISVSFGDLKPIMGVLQQRIDLPLPEYAPLQLALTDENRADMVEAFLDRCRAPAQVGIQYRDEGPPSILIVDRDLPPEPFGYNQDTPMAGRWGAMAGGGRRVLRLDVYAGTQPYGSWLLPEASTKVIRAAAFGSHHVMLLHDALSGDQDQAERQWSAGISVWVERVEAVRSLIATLEDDED